LKPWRASINTHIRFSALRLVKNSHIWKGTALWSLPLAASGGDAGTYQLGPRLHLLLGSKGETVSARERSRRRGSDVSCVHSDPSKEQKENVVPWKIDQREVLTHAIPIDLLRLSGCIRHSVPDQEIRVEPLRDAITTYLTFPWAVRALISDDLPTLLLPVREEEEE
jgi:hypothetical protein